MVNLLLVKYQLLKKYWYSYREMIVIPRTIPFQPTTKVREENDQEPFPADAAPNQQSLIWLLPRRVEFTSFTRLMVYTLSFS